MHKSLDRIISSLTILFCFIFMSGMVQGQTTFLNRPSKTESATVLEKGIFQLESVYETGLTLGSDEEEREILFPGILLRYGLGWGIEFSISNQYETYEDKYVSIKGFTDIDFGTKIQLFKGDDKQTEVAIVSHLLLPTGSNGVSNERVGNETLLLVWHELTEKIAIEYNIGYSMLEIDAESGDFVYSFVTDYEINDKSGVFIETYGELIEIEELEASIDIGFAYQFIDNLELELAVGSGINHNKLLAVIGFSWRIGEQED